MSATAVLALVGSPTRPIADAPVLDPDRSSDWFARLYEDTIDSVYRYSFTLMRDAAAAEDLAADVYLKAWRSRSSLRDDRTVLPWLMSITHNLAISQMRGAKEVADVSLLSQHEDPTADPGAATFGDSAIGDLQLALRELTPEQQQVVFLRFFEGMPHEAVAARMGRNPNAVRAIQFRALTRLRKLLENHRAE